MTMVMSEMDWPAHDRPLLDWYIRKLGLNPFLAIWQDQSALNDSCPPRSKYRAFRARLSDALGHTTPKPTTPNPLPCHSVNSVVKN